ncbi:cyclase family protein [Butyricicoccus faecihominis]|uniref:cyclase family protein n=1 Tax=Butyricicoccus faecihominis TaxID=1712515 RepID=UPI0024797E41|nr:cyclase family protein [Butyricicoccus faecihominis]MCQ5128260.1 cyclase family protein [Butyricicoccus faecihominis]
MPDSLKILTKLLDEARFVDLSPTIEHNMPKWPTHPQIIVDQTITHEHDGYYCQCLVLGEHSGAHVDAPAHIHSDMMKHTIDTYSPNKLFGRAILYDLSQLNAQPGERITAEQILQLEEVMGDRCEPNDIVLLHFGWQKYWTLDQTGKYYSLNEPGLAEDAVKLFAERKVKAVGSDTIACDTPVKAGVEERSYGHFAYWLPNHILIMEMLHQLDQLPTRSYFAALPLKIKNGSGSPIRPIAIIPKDSCKED